MMEPCSHRFTAAEGGARLAAAAAVANTLVTECGAFIATRLIHEEAFSIRGLLSAGRKRSIHLSQAPNVKADAYELGILTDLKVIQAVKYGDVLDWRQEFETNEVLVCTSEVLHQILEDRLLEMSQINIMVVDSCHTIYKDEHLQYIMKVYKQSEEDKRPRILAITYPLFNTPKADDDTDVDNSTEADTDGNPELQSSPITALVPLNSPEPIEYIKPAIETTLKELGVQENLDDFEMYSKLEYKIDELEKELCCRMDLAEDIDGCKRMSGPTTKPKEMLIEYDTKRSVSELSTEYVELESYMKGTVREVLEFVEDHRHDPTEIYGEELYEEFKNIPNPTIEPRQVIKEFLYILDELGPFAADKAAFSLLGKLEKLKIKVPYERHFLLLRLCTTLFVKIRCYAENVFNQYDEWDKIRLFSTPKLMRLIEILEKFTPPELKASIDNGTYVRLDRKNDFDDREKNDVKVNETDAKVNENDAKANENDDKVNKNDDKINENDVKINDIDDKSTENDEDDNSSKSNDVISIESPRDKLLSDLDKCDFKTLGNRIEDRLNMVQGNLKELDIGVEEKPVQIHPLFKSQLRERPLYTRTRPRGRRAARTARPPHAASDALCALVFLQEPLLAKILYLCIVDITRARPAVSYINCQYCAVEPIAEFKECQKQGKRHEEVLKKFRMHECNLLLTTSALEEGIDLPRCNLVLRWDTPPSYRSYVLCRSRSRAVRSSSILLGARGQTDQMLHCLATYKELDQIITRKCGCGIQNEPSQDEESHADTFNTTIKPYTPPTNKTCVCTKNRIKNDIAKSMKRTISDSENEVFDSEYNILDLKHMQLSDDKNEKSDGKSEKSDDKSEKSDDKSEKSDGKSEKCMCMSSQSESVASVDLNSAISLINRYCAKLPSDTFTRLAPQWWIERVHIPEWARPAYVCTLRLPLNCPVKYNIVGHPMPTRVLARRMAALQACRILHMSGELDNQLMPIGKENFKAIELESAHPVQDTILTENASARPGTTKRRQYYYKRTAWAFTNCQPVIDTSDSEIEKTEANGHKVNAVPELKEGSDELVMKKTDDEKLEGTCGKETSGRKNMLYAIESSLWCALPERYNTRGRRLHAPQHADQALAILMARDEPTNLQIPAFPVYTRSGEVRVSVEHVPDADVRMSPRRGRLVRRFMHFVFTEVLRVRRRGMALDNDGSTRNNYYIVPTVKTMKEDGKQKIDIDWAFLEQIYNHTEQQNLATPLCPRRTSEGDSSVPLKNPQLKEGEVFVFEAERYKEAVVTPWYRNQDQPQFFLVAEICSHLTPESAFPSPTHDTFRSYYRSKYKVELTQPDQPLLDVDHTSARLNLLTPRYVNRKGVALPVSSERTRRAKRDRLDQKQILVPELCTVHPFAAPLWFATVALPCVLYRINALLIADEIRRAVALDVGVGVPKIDETTMPGFVWPPLDFGWCLAEVLSADAEKSEKKKEDSSEKESVIDVKVVNSLKSDEITNGDSDGEEKEKTINDILQEEQERLNESTDNESGFEIGTWSNDMASSIPEMDDIYDEWSEPLPPNLTFCTSANGGVNWCDPVQKPKPEFKAPRGQYTMADSDCSYSSSDFDSDDSDYDVDSESDAESGFGSNKGVSAALGVRIEYKTAHEAEAVDMDTRKETKPSPQRDPRHEKVDRAELYQLLSTGDADPKYIENFRTAVETHKQTLVNSGQLITKDKPLSDLLPETKDNIDKSKMAATQEKVQEIFPYENQNLNIVDGQISIESIERNKRVLMQKIKKSLPDEEIKNMSCFFMKDINIDDPNYVNEKIANVGFDSKEKYVEKVLNYERKEFKPYYDDCKGQNGDGFDFDYQPDLDGHPGPSPSVILQALTMSNANDGINLERLETIGDSFLKFAITAYLYCAHPTVHEGKLSHMRSKQVSNLNLYRLGRSARLGARMIASKFEPHDNWLPPCHKAPPSPKEQHDRLVQEMRNSNMNIEQESTGCYIPYNLITQHSIPDKSIADCVEALIGAYLLSCGPRGALLFMAWLGISVLPHHRIQLHKKPQTHPKSDSKSNSKESEESWATGHFGPAGARRPYQDENGNWYQIIYGELKAPPSPLLRYISDPEGELERMLSGYDELENTLQYRFKDRSLLLQALTHASHHKNTLTDCYQRLEFLGDAILDYLITRHLYEDPRRHSPGALTDLRSALVNNTIFATLAVRHGFHKYFRHTSPGLNEVLMKYVKIQEENGHSISEEHYLIQEDEQEQAEDVEVPKALGDLFESIAGAIFLDSGMSLGAVWGSYVRLMGAELEAFSAAAPKSPVRELLEAEPDTAKFSKPERLADGRRVRVCVEVFGRGTFKGIGRNYRIAKGTAARCALRHLRKHRR